MTLRKVGPYPLWIGNASDARTPRVLFDAGICAVVDLAANEPATALPREFISCRFPLVDGSENARSLLLISINTIAELLRANIPTLVACSGGMSRSPALAAAAISKLTGRDPNEYLLDCVATGAADVSPTLWQDILEAIS